MWSEFLLFKINIICDVVITEGVGILHRPSPPKSKSPLIYMLRSNSKLSLKRITIFITAI